MQGDEVNYDAMREKYERAMASNSVLSDYHNSEWKTLWSETVAPPDHLAAIHGQINAIEQRIAALTTNLSILSKQIERLLAPKPQPAEPVDPERYRVAKNIMRGQ